jgi:hypothetical protein
MSCLTNAASRKGKITVPKAESPRSTWWEGRIGAVTPTTQTFTTYNPQLDLRPVSAKPQNPFVTMPGLPPKKRDTV